MNIKKLKFLAIIALIILLMYNFTSCDNQLTILLTFIPLAGIGGIIWTAVTAFIIIATIAFILIAIIVSVNGIIKETKEEKIRLKKEEKRRLEEEEKLHLEEEKRRLEEEEKLRLEEEWKKSTKCVICGECSMGNYICENCFNRAKKLAEETKTPKNCSNRYEYIFEKYKNLHLSVINASEKQERIYYASLLVAIALELKYDYFTENITEDTYVFLEDLREINYKPDEAFFEKYKKYNLKNASEKNEAGTFNTSGKIFKCNDGDYVRSKAEREIDNFFFNNRIWHIYEYRYEHPITKEWAVPDFYLPDYNLFIEYFGLDTPEYIENREHKIEMYRSDKSIKFEYLTFEDDADLNTKLLEICKKYNIPTK